MNSDFKLYNENEYKELILKISETIKNGVSKNDGTTRPFQILDYYMLTDLKPDFLAKAGNAINVLTLDDYKKFRSSLGKYRLDVKMNVEQNVKGRFAIVEVVNGEEVYHEATEEEKLETLDWMIQNNIPLYELLYTQALRRHMNGELIKKDPEIETLDFGDELNEDITFEGPTR